MKTNKRKRTQRQVIHPRVHMDLYNRLKAYAARTGAEDGAIVNAALAQYLDKSSDTALVLRRLDRITRRIGRLQREIDGLTEFSTTWAQIWFAHTPQLTPEARKTAQQSAKSRYSEMFDFIRKKISGRNRFLVDLLGPDESDDLAVDGGTPPGAGSGLRQ
jgi:predicted DNA-binding protein